MQETRKNNNELIKKILLTAAGVTALSVILTTAMIAPNCIQLLKIFDIDKKRKREIQKKLYELKKKRLVKIYNKDGKDIIEISENGRKKILKYKFDEMKIAHPKKWDKIWRIIIFDIPEKHKSERDALRLKLKNLNFYQLQKSVFVFPYYCKNEIEFIAEFFEIKKFISYIEAKNIKEDKKLLQYFDLKL